MNKCKICGKDKNCQNKYGERDGFGCFKCQGIKGVKIHSVWCVNSEFCEAKTNEVSK